MLEGGVGQRLEVRQHGTNTDGISKLSFMGGDAGKPANLPLPTPISSSEYFDLDTVLTVRLHSTSPAACWSSTFTASGTKKNESTRFSARNPERPAALRIFYGSLPVGSQPPSPILPVGEVLGDPCQHLGAHPRSFLMAGRS